MLRTISTLLLCSLAFTGTTYARNIYVAKNGSDTNNGSFNAPYKTINKAANSAVAGDNVYIRAGQYEEILRPKNSGQAGKPITFQSYQNEKVVISAMQALGGWTKDSGQVYRTTVNFDLGQENFVIHNETALDLARWPNNTDGDPYTPNSLRNTGGTPGSTEFNARLDYNGIPNWDWSKGGSVWFYGDKPGSGWIAWKAFIKWSNGNSVGFDLNKNPTWIRTFHAPADKGDFFLEGIREALDYKNEWFYNPANKQLYVQLPNGAKPQNGAVKMRKRKLAIDLNNRNYIQVKNLAVFGGSINITGNASNNLLQGVSSFYGNHTRGIFKGFNSGSQSLHVQGKNNTIDRVEVGHGSGTGVKIAGDNNKLLNSHIHDFNTLGSYDAIVVTRGGRNTLVRGNTIYGGGRDAINAFNRDSEYSYNDVSRSNLVADDCALFYTVGGPQNVEIHHNWFHDAYSSGSKNKAAGIYLDNDATGFKVHHNVVWNTEWSNIQMNWDVTDVDVFNNTFVDGSATMGAWHKAGTKFTDVRVWNNLSDKNNWEPQSDKQNNVTYTQNPFVNKAGGNFNLKSNAQARDKGRFISGITDNVTDARPDVGAYEYGKPRWVAGVNWNTKSGPANRCYNLPGEDCGGSTQPDPVDPTPPNPTPNPGGTKAIPGKIEAETYSAQNGTRNVNLNPGVSVGYINDGDFIEFDTDVSQAGTYSIAFRLSSGSQGGQIIVSAGGQQVATAQIGNTGGWRTFKQTTVNADLAKGKQKLRVAFKNAASNGYLMDVDWLDIKLVKAAPAPVPVKDDVTLRTRTKTLSQQKQYNFSIDYKVAAEHELVAELWRGNQWLASGVQRVQAGSGNKTITVNLRNVPATGNDYVYKAYTYPVGGTWRDATDWDTVTGVTITAAQTSLLSNGIYALASPANGQRLISLSRESHNARVANSSSTLNQQWQVTHINNDVYTFKNRSTNRYLEVPFGECKNHANVATWTAATDSHHRWKVSKNGANYMLQPAHCLAQALDRAAGASNANVLLWESSKSNPNQQWNIAKP